MKNRHSLIAVSLVAACSAAMAGKEYGTVVSSRAVTAQVSVPQQQCTEQAAVVQPPTTGGGALLGALVGGLIGHNLGGGMGRAAATGLGIVAGSAIGDHNEAANTPASTVPVRTCQAVSSVESRVVGYDVTYDYNGQRYTTRLPQDPGERIALNVSVVPQQAAGTAPAAPATVTVTPAAVVSAPPVVVSSYPYSSVYDGPYGYRAAYGPVVPQLGLVIGGGYWHHGR